MAASGIDTLLQFLRKCVHCSVDDFLWDFFPSRYQTLLQRFNRLVGFRTGFGFQYAPNCVVQHVQIRGIWWPLTVVSLGADVDFDELGDVVSDQVLCFFRLVGWSPVLLKNPMPLSISPSGPWKNFGLEKFSVQRSVLFDAFGEEVQWRFHPIANSGPHHNRFWALLPANDVLF